ncbi:YopX family protein [Streptococcus mitis]|uniref:YopX family protein n=1 Tax=Streptococcus mitis TaxID=28037 RepID=UPI0039C179F3
MIPKFRAWDVLAEKMIDEIQMISFVRKEIIGKFSDGSTSVPLKFEDERNGEDVILMQSTGLKDKNDKEIFEGDILACKTDDEVINLNIFWDEEHALFMFESKKYNERELLAELVEDNIYPFEITGNIYENPELLEDLT